MSKETINEMLGGATSGRVLLGTEVLRLPNFRPLESFRTPIEERFERLTRLAVQALALPVVGITTVTQETQWFKSVRGWDIAEIPLSNSLCEDAIRTGQPDVIGDLSRSPRYAGNEYVMNAPRFRFRASVPLKNDRGVVIGTFCAMGFQPDELSPVRFQSLLDFAELAQRELLIETTPGVQSALISRLSIDRRQGLLDPLTKLWNRRGGELLLEGIIEAADTAHNDLAVLAIDVNGLKDINDRFGDSIGDQALRMVAEELLASIRDGDGVCRYGGDRFLLFMSNIDRPSLGPVSRRIRGRIAANEIPVQGNPEAIVTVSVGTAWAKAGNPRAADQLIAAADRSLCKQRQQHRG